MGAAKKKSAGPAMDAKEKLAKSKADGAAHICLLCRTTFTVTSKKAALELHRANKHEKSAIADCFTTFDNAK